MTSESFKSRVGVRWGCLIFTESLLTDVDQKCTVAIIVPTIKAAEIITTQGRVCLRFFNGGDFLAGLIAL